LVSHLKENKKMKVYKIAIATTLLALVLNSVVHNADAAITQSVNVDEIVQEAEKAAYYAGEDGIADARMLIIDSQGRKQMRQFTILRRDITDNGDQQMMVFFSRPSDVRDTVFRVEKHADLKKDDDRWLYMPALDLVKRISAGDKRTSFVGSHFFYEDVSGRTISEDKFELIEENKKYYVLKGVPLDNSTVEFDYYSVTIDKKSFLPILINFYKENDDNYRRVEAVEIQDVQGFPTVVRSKVSDLKTGGYTLMEFRNIKYNVGLDDDLFSERSLRNPPRRWLD